MEKKAYERPVAEVVDIETERLMLPASVKSVQSADGLIFGGAGGGNAARSNGRRDAWSNGWDD